MSGYSISVSVGPTNRSCASSCVPPVGDLSHHTSVLQHTAGSGRAKQPLHIKASKRLILQAFASDRLSHRSRLLPSLYETRLLVYSQGCAHHEHVVKYNARTLHCATGAWSCGQPFGSDSQSLKMQLNREGADACVWWCMLHAKCNCC
jgi:hypothetical protein